MKFHHIALDEIGSTNTEALTLARSGAVEGTVVTARIQTAGRGRREGRTWQSPVGNLYASFILRPAVPRATWGQLSFVAALAVGETVGSFKVSWRLKWPNDVLVDGLKIAGILLETTETADGTSALVLGVGLNIAPAPVVEGRAVTSLADQGVKGASPDTVLAILEERLATHYTCWQREGFAPLRTDWLAHAHPPGERLTGTLPDGTPFTGTFQDLREDGALCLLQEDAPPLILLSGEINPPPVRG